MGEKAALIQAAEAIKNAIEAFVHPEEAKNIRVFESSPGHLRVIVGSDRFKGKGPAECQNIIWDHLTDKVPPDQLVYCFGVHPMDVEEYEEEFASQTTGESMRLFIEGRGLMGEDADE
ncbi:MAG: hypothetical protein JSU63_04365 [Phycisphaerales bacterium]|nr:MAG: hypothetical protein JSU63_04365 [Phycisphaerales bacterium]